MRDPATGRLYRAPGQPERFDMAEKPLQERTIERADWMRRLTGYDIDQRTVYITEGLRNQYNAEHPRARAKKRGAYALLPPQEMRTSERKVFGTCHKQWQWSYVEGLEPNLSSNALWFGSAIHEALAAWYLQGTARGPHPAETFTAVLDGDRKLRVENAEEEEERVQALDLGVGMLEHYIETFGRDEHMHILAVEETYALIFKENGRPFLRYLLTMDGLYRDLETGQVKILEHKTAKTIRPGHVNGAPLVLDHQAGAYYAAAPYVLPLDELLKPGEKISGITYNFLRKAIKDERPMDADGHRTNKPQKVHYQLALEPHGVVVGKSMTLDVLAAKAAELGITVLGEVSKDQPPPYFHREDVFRSPEEQHTQLERIQAEAKWMRAMRQHDPDYPIMKTPGDHCAWCPFKRMCELDEQGDADAVQSFKESMMHVRDPYEQYRKAA